MHQTHELYLNKQISGNGLRDLYAPAEERMTQLQAELPKLEAEVDFLKVNRLLADDVLHEAGSLYENWPSMPPADKRRGEGRGEGGRALFPQGHNSIPGSWGGGCILA